MTPNKKVHSDRAITEPCDKNTDRWWRTLFRRRSNALLRPSKCESLQDSQAQPAREDPADRRSITEDSIASSDPEDNFDTLAPLSCIRIDVPSENSAEYSLPKSTRFLRNGLDRNDSIYSYLEQVDEAHESLVPGYDAIEHSMSVITMDPALTYRHSIILQEFSMSMRSIGSTFSMYEDDDGQMIDGKVAKLPLTEI